MILFRVEISDFCLVGLLVGMLFMCLMDIFFCNIDLFVIFVCFYLIIGIGNLFFVFIFYIVMVLIFFLFIEI